MTFVLSGVKAVHIIGIAGTGMSAIGRVLAERGYTVSGSDLRSNDETATLNDLGVMTHQGHDAAHMQGADVVVATSAVKDDHIEIVAAHAKDIPVVRRREFLGALLADNRVIAVAGTHGKTTTTAMIVHILHSAGLDAGYICGSRIENTGQNAHHGASDWFVIEADEYGLMFLGLEPEIAVLTSTDWDHPDFFETHEAMLDAYRQFVARIKPGGCLIGSAVDLDKRFFEQQGMRVIRYWVENYTLKDAGARSEFAYRTVNGGRDTGVLAILGLHNAKNATAALEVARAVGADNWASREALETFRGTLRRFTEMGVVQDVRVINDYAHHPVAIRTTIDSGLQSGRALWAVWQPHTYSRTRTLWDDYLLSFEGADGVIVTDIFAAREQDDGKTSAADFVAQLDHPQVFHAPTFADAVRILREHVEGPATILIMSAGDAPEIGRMYLQARGS